MKNLITNQKWLLLLLLVTATSLGAWAQNQNLTQSVCVGNQPYYVDPIAGATFSWSITGGVSGVDWQINQALPTDRNITVDWNTPGTYVLSVFSTLAACPSPAQSVTVTVVAQPVGPTLLALTPNAASVCEGTDVSATFNAGTGGVGCADAFEYRYDGAGVWTSYTPGSNIATVGHTLVEIQGQRSGCTAGAGCTGTPWVTLASWTVTPTPTANISYTGSPWCTNAIPQSVTLTGTGGYTGGTYSSTAGLSIDAATGEITPTTSTPGTYTVTYTIPAAGGCGVVTATASVTITLQPTASISYTGSPWCTSAASQTVTLTGTGAFTGGTFSSTAGLTIDAATGEITPATSTAGTYIVTYTTPVAGGCGVVTTTTTITITLAPTASISYTGSPWCTSATSQTVTLTGTGVYTGGTFSSTAGLSIDAATGEITPSTSTPGTYLVTYTISAAGGCGVVTATTSVTITLEPTASISYTGSPWCTSDSPQVVSLTGTGGYTGGTFSSIAGLSIDAATGEITPASSTPGTYTVTYTTPAAGGCNVVTATTSVTINAVPTTSGIWHN